MEENGHTCLLEDIEVKRAHQKYQFELFVSNDDSDVTMENITTINVFNSEFQFIPREIFEYFPNLKVLNMNKVKLKKILKNNFENAANLEILNMKKNYLVELHETDFASLKNLRKLDLSGNVKLKFVAPNFTVQMPNLESLNMLDCSCVNFKIEDLNPNDAEWIFENCNESTNSSLEDYNEILYAEYTDIPLDVPKDSTNFILYDVVDSIVSFFNSESEEYEEDEYDESTTNPNDTQYRRLSETGSFYQLHYHINNIFMHCAGYCFHSIQRMQNRGWQWPN